MGQHLATQSNCDAFTSLCQEQGELHGQEDGLLVPSIVTQLPLGRLWIEDHIMRELAQPRFDVTRRGGAITGTT